MERVVKTLSGALAERDDALRALAVAVLAREHVVFLGPTGTAKSFMVRGFARALGGLSYFHTLLNPTSPPEALLGPMDLAAYEQGEYRHRTAGMLPEAELAFVDEVFKGNWAILNLLLPLMEERVYHNGGTPQPCPLISLVGASNETPREEGLEAVWDRFLLRVQVDYVQDRAAFRRLLAAPPSLDGVPQVLSREELREEQEAAARVEIPGVILDRVVVLKDELARLGITVSDRRWVKAIHGQPGRASVLQAFTFLDGRTSVTTDDLEALVWVCWQDPSQIPDVMGVVYGVANPTRQAVLEAKEAAYEAYSRAAAEADRLEQEARQARETGDAGNARQLNAQASNVVLEALGEIRERLQKLEELAEREGASTRTRELLDQAIEQARGWQAELMRRMGV
ncbi:MAG TPA: ATPase [Anaerolineales bacterium]|nr:ATPase [Anaerolineales bacterium]